MKAYFFKARATKAAPTGDFIHWIQRVLKEQSFDKREILSHLKPENLAMFLYGNYRMKIIIAGFFHIIAGFYLIILNAFCCLYFSFFLLFMPIVPTNNADIMCKISY